MGHEPTPSHYVLPASDRDDPFVAQLVSGLNAGTLSPEDLRLRCERAKRRIESDPVSLKYLGIALQHSGDYENSQLCFEHLFRIARHDTDRCAALANISAGLFRQLEYARSFAVAVEALQFDPKVLAPWLIACAVWLGAKAR